MAGKGKGAKKKGTKKPVTPTKKGKQEGGGQTSSKTNKILGGTVNEKTIHNSGNVHDTHSVYSTYVFIWH